MFNDNLRIQSPVKLAAVLQQAQSLGFTASCEEKTGALLRLLAASKPGSRFLELGTGVGVSTSWILDGMDAESTLVSVELDDDCHASARESLGSDRRLSLVRGSVVDYLLGSTETYDFVFADTFSGKFTDRDLVIDRLTPGAFYVIDDLLPQANWPVDDHPLKVRSLVEELENDARLQILKLGWASGLVLAVRKPVAT